MTFTLPASSGEANSGALLYLGISGVLHPSVSEYSQRYDRLPGSDGHTLYEGAPLLEKLLEGWPEVRIVLTSSLPRIYSFEMVLEQLGRQLARRVDGYTYEDLTTRVLMADARTPYSGDDYRMLDKADIVRVHVAWRKPAAFVVLDDEDLRWTGRELEENVVIVDGCEGLLSASAQERLAIVLARNFGPAQGDLS